MSRIKSKLAITIAALALVASATATLAGPVSLVRPLGKAARSEFMTVGAQTIAPFAHVRFCMATPEECREASGPTTVELTTSKLALLNRVNERVNNTIEPYMPDGPETWVVNPDRGNCHDYAVSKRHDLIRAGWPPASLRLAVAYTRGGVGHLVVVVRTDKGDLVLDNLTNRIVTWNRSGLRFVSVEAGDKPRVWYAMR
jgi:predicted transglutaminase-like cysteine proteinase